jgi:hypothetical protein
MKRDSLLALMVFIGFVLACGNGGPPEGPTPPTACSCVRTDPSGNQTYTFVCEGPRGKKTYDIGYADASWNEKVAEREVLYQCKCEQEEPPKTPEMPAGFPILFACTGQSIPKGYVVTGYGRSHTSCPGPAEGGGFYRTVACPGNPNWDAGDEIALCGGQNTYNTLPADIRRVIDDNWTRKTFDPDPLKQRCYRQKYPDAAEVWDTYWILVKK